MALTRRQREIYDFICEFVEANGYSPSLEEIGAHFELASVATVHKHIQHLVAKGFLKKAWNRSRSVEPVLEDVSFGELLVKVIRDQTGRSRRSIRRRRDALDRHAILLGVGTV